MKKILIGAIILLLLIVPHISAINYQNNYVILTTNAIVEESQKLDDFIQHKESMGFHVLVVTEDDFDHLEGDYPNKKPDKIRQWLIENYQEMGIEYVLLVGDPTPDTFWRGDGEDIQPFITEYNIPMKTFRQTDSIIGTFFPNYPLKFLDEFPSDSYYADLDRDWNPLTKYYCADYFDFNYYRLKNITYEPEVFVGRFPLYNNSVVALDTIIQKTIDYETSQNTDWRKNTFFAASFYRPNDDGAEACQRIINDIIMPANFSYYRMYMQGSAYDDLDSEYDSEEELRNGTVINHWKDNYYGIVGLYGHGSYDHVTIGYSYLKYMKDGYILTSNQTELLNNAYPSIVFLESCDTGFPEKINIGYNLLKNGAISVYCPTRLVSNTAHEIVYRTVDKVISGQTIGESLYRAKAEIWSYIGIDHYDNLLQFNLYGDPSIFL